MTMHPPHHDNDATGRFSRLLEAIASEISALGNDIFRLGDRLTGAIAAGDQNEQIRELQNFDVIGQGMQSHAGILKTLAERMDAPHMLTNDDIDTLIGAIPFHAIRERLGAALDNRATEFVALGPETSEFF